MQCGNHTRCPAYVIIVRMTQNECVDFATQSTNVWHHGAPARVAAVPATSGIDHDPMSVRRAERDGIALSYVDHVEFKIAVAACDEWRPQCDTKCAHSYKYNPHGPSGCGCAYERRSGDAE